MWYQILLVVITFSNNCTFCEKKTKGDPGGLNVRQSEKSPVCKDLNAPQ